MPSSHAEALIAVVDRAARELRALDETVVSARGPAGTWSVKEILGHLVDSAANNHQRFVRAQYEKPLGFPPYAQDDWVRLQDYQASSWPELVELWRLYNHHLAHVMRRLDDDALDIECTIGRGDPVTLGFLVEDYLRHLRHHLAQIESRRG